MEDNWVLLEALQILLDRYYREDWFKTNILYKGTEFSIDGINKYSNNGKKKLVIVNKI